MAWMRLDSSFRFHRKVRRLSKRLEISMVQARGHLVTFWMAVLTEAPDGCLQSWEAQDVEDAAEWEGEAGVLFGALSDLHFIESNGSGLEVHGWMEYAGSLKDAIRKKEERGRQGSRPDLSGTIPGQSADVLPRARPDGRTDGRTEEDGHDGRTDETERNAPASAPPPVALALFSDVNVESPDLQPILTFPAIGKGVTWTLTRGHLEQLQQAYPTLDVEAEMRKALVKLNTGATDKKTPKGYPRFCTNWLDNSVNKPSMRASSGPAQAASTHVNGHSGPKQFDLEQLAREDREIAEQRARRQAQREQQR